MVKAGAFFYECAGILQSRGSTAGGRTMVARALLMALLLQGALAGHAEAQTQARACFWPGSPPECSSWVITEAGVYTQVTDRQSRVGSDSPLLLASAVGWMRNVSPRTAWGGEVFLSFEEAASEFRGGVAARTRRWLSPRAAVDVSAGVHLFGYQMRSVKRGSPMLAARVTYADKIAAVARLDILLWRGLYAPYQKAASTRLYLGVEAGAKYGAVAMGLAALAGLVAAGGTY